MYKNKLMNVINAISTMGYITEGVGTADGTTEVRDYFDVDSDDILEGELVWIYMEPDNVEWFKHLAEPDKVYTNNNGDIILIYQA